MTGFIGDWLELFVGTRVVDFYIGDYHYTHDVAADWLFIMIVVMCFVIVNFWIYFIRGKLFTL